MKVDNFITFFLFSGQGKKALDTRATFLCDIHSKSAHGWVRSHDDEIQPNLKSPYSTVLNSTVMTDAPKADCLLTSAPIVVQESVVSIIKNSKPKYFIWDIGNKYTQQPLKKATALLEFYGYDLMFIKDTSTRLGIPYNDTRYILIGKRDEDLVLLPSARESTCTNPLSFYFNTKSDWDADVIEYNGVYYQGDIRPWTHVAFPEDNILPERTLGYKYGATYYVLDDKVHRITAPECAVFLNQERLQLKIKASYEVFLQLREMPYLMWLDYIERMV